MAYRNSTTSTVHASGGTNSVAVPSGIAANDICILTTSLDAVDGSGFFGDVTYGFPSGFTPFTEQINDQPDGNTMAAAWKRCDGTESGNFTVTWSSQFNNAAAGDMALTAVLFSGRSRRDPPVMGSWENDTNGGSAFSSSPIALTAPAVTALVGDDLLWIATPDTTNAPIGVSFGSAPTGFTERQSGINQAPGSGWVNYQICTQDNVSAGSTGTVAGSFSFSGGNACKQTGMIRLPSLLLTRSDVLDDNTKIDSAGAISYTTGSFTPPANSLLVLSLWMLNGPGDDVQGGNTVSGGGLTWTRRSLGGGQTTAPIYTGVGETWTAPVGASPSSMTITITPTNNAVVGTDNSHLIFDLDAYTDYKVSSPIGATASGALSADGDAATSLTLSANPLATSYVHAGRAAGSDGNDGPATVGSGFTETYDAVHSDAGYGALQTQVRTGSTSTNVPWVATSTGHTTFFMWANAGFALEIKEEAATSATDVGAIGASATATAAPFVAIKNLSGAQGVSGAGNLTPIRSNSFVPGAESALARNVSIKRKPRTRRQGI
jgi:hypothetical protein